MSTVYPLWICEDIRLSTRHWNWEREAGSVATSGQDLAARFTKKIPVLSRYRTETFLVLHRTSLYCFLGISCYCFRTCNLKSKRRQKFSLFTKIQNCEGFFGFHGFFAPFGMSSRIFGDFAPSAGGRLGWASGQTFLNNIEAAHSLLRLLSVLYPWTLLIQRRHSETSLYTTFPAMKY